MVNFIKQRIKRENLLPNKILVKHTRINELEKTIASELSTLIVANFAFPSKYSDIENNYLELRSIYKSLKQNGLLITVGWDESFNDELSEMWYRYIPDKIVSRNFEDWRLKRSNLFQSPRNCGLNWYKRGIRVPLKFSSVDIAARVMGYLFGRSAIDDILINNKTVWEMSIGITIDNKESIKKIFSRK